ncbi:MAG: two-component regulator propeller domain-containing protein [Bacteroidota bacterium]
MKIFVKIIVLFLFLFCGINYIFSQGVAIGEWRDHLPYNSCISITEGDGMVYCATKYSVFSFDKDDNSIERLNKINYLSDIGVSRVMYHNGLHMLVVTYTNGNIDLIENGSTVTNISDIKRKPIPGNKTINNILFIDNYAYLSCGFGIVVLDLEKKEIKDTYYIGPGGSQIEIFDLTTDGGFLYAATESGVYEADLSSPYLSNYQYWTKHTEMPYPDLKYNAIVYFNNALYVNLSYDAGDDCNDDTLFKYQTGVWNYFDSANYANRYGLHVFNNELVVIDDGDIKIFDQNDTLKIWTYNWPDNPVYPAPRDAIIDPDQNNIVWIADANIGIIKNTGIWSSTNFQPNGPGTANVFDIAVEGNNLWVAPGGLDGTWNNMWNQDGLFSFIDEEWSTYNKSNVDSFPADPPDTNTIYDVVCVAVNPANPAIAYAGTWSRGLIEFTNQTFTQLYKEGNSSLVEGSGNKIRIGGITFDSDNNMWVTNSGVNKALHVKMAYGTWKAFDLSGYVNQNEVGDIIIDNQNCKWMILPRNNGLLVFNDNNTITNTSDDQIKKLSNTLGNGGLPSNNLYSIAVDLDGEIWVGTDKGIAVFYNPENVFSGSNFDAQQILVDLDGYIQPLLESEVITTIAVDGANRKWIGTERAGVFLMSADGTQEIEHFTDENSPLFSNTINTVAINQNTGEVFFGTDKGIISYKSTATEGVDNDTSIVVYPNPVTENYTGYIGIRGLAANSDVKITDISGTLIYQTIAEGGQAVWNGRNFQGEKAQTGVYLVFCSNEDGSQTVVAKIMIIN